MSNSRRRTTKTQTASARRREEAERAAWLAKVFAAHGPGLCGDPGCECWQDAAWPAKSTGWVEVRPKAAKQ